jgi:hypothetical protein
MRRLGGSGVRITLGAPLKKGISPFIGKSLFYTISYLTPFYRRFINNQSFWLDSIDNSFFINSLTKIGVHPNI